MTAERITPLDGEFSGTEDVEPDGIQFALVITPEVPGRAFNEAVIAHWRQSIAYRAPTAGWRTDYHREGADWVYEHLERARNLGATAANAA